MWESNARLTDCFDLSPCTSPLVSSIEMALRSFEDELEDDDMDVGGGAFVDAVDRG